MSQLEQSRRRFEGAWNDLQGSLKSEFGGVPRWRKKWVRPVVGFAAGLGLAYLIWDRVGQGGRSKIGRGRRQQGRLQATPQGSED